MKKPIYILVAILILGLKSHAGLLFNYSELAIKDLDQMNKLVSEKVVESKRSSSGKVVPLKEALQAVYSRPNEDDMIEKIVAPLRVQLDYLDSWEKTISQLTDEALNALKNPGGFKPVVQVTYIVFLENLLGELKPYAKVDGFERRLIEKIRTAKVIPTKAAVSERKLRMMKDITSPSVVAEKILTNNKLIPQLAQPKSEMTDDSAGASPEAGK